MNKILVTLCALCCGRALLAADGRSPAIIPLPQKMAMAEGVFRLEPKTKIFEDRGCGQTARQLAATLRQSTGYPLKVILKRWGSDAIPHGILLTTKSARKDLGVEGYELIVTTNSVVIRAPTQAGLFYGAQTLLQLLPPEIFSPHPVPNANWQAPCVRIEDWPRFQWRGLMLDVSRHFFSKSEVETILDEMARYKLNTFHWHLVDDPGWRIEIKKYPKLTQIGAWRKQSDLALPHDVHEQTNPRPAWMAAPPSSYGSDGRYGGFYTQHDIREIVAYAAARHIAIIPEIEMPGHSAAALAAYPQYSTETVAGSKPGVYSPANADVFNFLDDVLTEVFQLFPSKYIHIGGDEVQKEYWRKSPQCQALMKQEGLNNEAELQSWFIRRMEKFVNAHGKTLVGWSEILQGGLAQNAVVMDWIGGGLEAASAGHGVVMTPTDYCYLDHYQSTNHSAEPEAIGGFLPLKNVYSFEPIPAKLPADFQSHILGAQGNLWTEYIASLPYAEYMIFPRACALAEVVWSSKNGRDWKNFQLRLRTDEQRLDQRGVSYRHDNGIK